MQCIVPQCSENDGQDVGLDVFSILTAGTVPILSFGVTPGP